MTKFAFEISWLLQCKKHCIGLPFAHRIATACIFIVHIIVFQFHLLHIICSFNCDYRDDLQFDQSPWLHWRYTYFLCGSIYTQLIFSKPQAARMAHDIFYSIPLAHNTPQPTIFFWLTIHLTLIAHNTHHTSGSHVIHTNYCITECLCHMCLLL